MVAGTVKATCHAWPVLIEQSPLTDGHKAKLLAHFEQVAVVSRWRARLRYPTAPQMNPPLKYDKKQAIALVKREQLAIFLIASCLSDAAFYCNVLVINTWH